MKYFSLTSLLFLFFQLNALFGQNKFTLNGYIRDAESGEELIGATVFVTNSGSGGVTNAYGFYSVTLPAGTYVIRYAYLGYKTTETKVELSKDVTQNVDLEEESVEIEEMVITAERAQQNFEEINMSRNELDVDQIKKLPALFGEPDIIKTIQMLPGVITAGEGTSSYFVRGGSADQNLILIDEAPIYDPSHLFGLFSVFNGDVIKDADLYKGGIPARFGGRLSSILDVRTRDGNNKKIHGSAGIGTLASKLLVEGPLRKEKSSFLVSARRSYADIFIAAAGEDARVSFYDINAKANWRLNNNNRFFAAFYVGKDSFSFNKIFGFDWGNRTATLRWNHHYTEKLFSNLTLIGSQFAYGLELKDPVQGFEWTSRIQQFTLKADNHFFASPKVEIKFGYDLSYRRFFPGKIEPNQPGSIFTTSELEHQFALDHALYLESKQTISERFTLELGVRLSIFQNIGETTIRYYEDINNRSSTTVTGERKYDQFENIKTFVNPEPRVSGRFLLNSQSSLKASYNRMVQNVHLVSSGTVPLPLNTWTPSNPYLKPQIADQFAVGFFRNFRSNTIEFETELYYKNISKITDFADNAMIFFNEDLATEFRQGKSTSYGWELMFNKKEGKLNGFISYTLSKTTRKVSDVNQGRTFLANYDRRHNVSISGVYELNRAWSFGLNFVYNTGRPTTIPTGRYQYKYYSADYFSERNSYQLPDYHRMDISATLTPGREKPRKLRSKWVFALYNVYNRKNPFSLFTEDRFESGEVVGKQARMIYLFPILPSITYSVEF
jgi:hypothetical protein